MIKLISIQVGRPRAIGGTDSASGWMTGFFKEPVFGPIWVGMINLAGDRQAGLECTAARISDAEK
jgi:hypothetical protein